MIPKPPLFFGDQGHLGKLCRKSSPNVHVRTALDQPSRTAAMHVRITFSVGGKKVDKNARASHCRIPHIGAAAGRVNAHISNPKRRFVIE